MSAPKCEMLTTTTLKFFEKQKKNNKNVSPIVQQKGKENLNKEIYPALAKTWENGHYSQQSQRLNSLKLLRGQRIHKYIEILTCYQVTQ